LADGRRFYGDLGSRILGLGQARLQWRWRTDGDWRGKHPVAPLAKRPVRRHIGGSRRGSSGSRRGRQRRRRRVRDAAQVVAVSNEWRSSGATQISTGDRRDAPE
jgi:hypothetical protein